jgi:signal transduction histidine kinase
MAAGIAHELNQPLTGVRGLAELTLIEQDQNWELSREELRERLGQIIEQADRMVHIIDRVRTFARGAGNPETSLVQVNDVVRSGIELLGVQFSTRKLELKMELAEDLPLVRANPYSLEEVVINLLSNARDATEAHRDEEGAARRPGVLIRTGSNGVDNDSRVQIQIIDSGVGIPADIVPKVFDPFFTTKGPKKGTGLGLAISLSIVEQFGGDLQVESMPGTGTTMTISLPVAQEPHGD